MSSLPALRKLTNLVELDLAGNQIPARIRKRTLAWVEKQQDLLESEFSDYAPTERNCAARSLIRTPRRRTGRASSQRR